MEKGLVSRREAWSKSFDVNVTSTFLLTERLAPLLLRSSSPRLIFITSGGASLSVTENLDLPSNAAPPSGWPKPPSKNNFLSYKLSKIAMNLMAREWCKQLRNDGVKVHMVSPGLLATNLGGDPKTLKDMGGVDPAVGARLVKQVIDGEFDSACGKVIHQKGIWPW